MKGKYVWLAGLLAAQLVLALVVFREDATRDRATERQPLLPVAASEVDRIVIGHGDERAELVRDGTHWQLPGLAGLPAAAAKVSDELGRIAAIETGWPVADTNSSHTRFEVADEGAQRHVQLYRGDGLVADFYLGTSPGFRKVHLRRAGGDAVFAVALSVNDLPARSADWLDRSLLAVAEPTRIAGRDYTLARSAQDRWVLSSPSAGGQSSPPTLDETRVGQLVNALANLQVQAVADAPAQPGDAMVLQVESPEGKLEFSFYGAGDEYYVRRSDIDRLFSLSRYDYDRIAGVGLDQLVATPRTASPDEGAQASHEEAATPAAG